MADCQKEQTQTEGQRGLVMVITGNGKGKTTSALGQALRALGHGWKVCIIQFMKGRKYGEVLCAEKYLPQLTFHQCGLDSFVKLGAPSDADLSLARKGMALAREALSSGEYDLVVLDEINVALYFQLVSLDEVLSAVQNKAEKVTVILTGRYAPEEVIEMADMVSEVREIKHHYAKGVKEKKGIEF